MRNIKGILAAIVTPCKHDGSVNYDVLKKIMDFQLERGIDGFYVGGGIAEAFLLTVEERKKILETVVEHSNGRAVVIAHVGSIGTDLTVDLGLHAKSAGVDVISAVTPFYYGFTQEQIIQYYCDVADRTGMPLMAYSGSLTVNAVDRLIKQANVVGMKYVSPDMYTLERFKQAHPGLVIYNGRDEALLFGLTAGADGGIGSTYNFMPEKFRKLVDFVKAGKYSEAQQVQHEINAIIPYLGKYGDIPVAKEFLTLHGLPCGDCRKPFTPLSDEGRAELKSVYETYLK